MNKKQNNRFKKKTKLFCLKFNKFSSQYSLKFINFSSPLFNTLTANYEITHRLLSFRGCETTSNFVLTHIQKSTFSFLASFL